MNFTAMLPFFVSDSTQKSKMMMSNYFLPSAIWVNSFLLNLSGEGKAYKAYEVLRDSTSN